SFANAEKDEQMKREPGGKCKYRNQFFWIVPKNAFSQKEARRYEMHRPCKGITDIFGIFHFHDPGISKPARAPLVLAENVSRGAVSKVFHHAIYFIKASE